MKRSLTVPMKAEGLTSMKIQYNFKTGVYQLEARKEWEPDLDFTRYNKDFFAESILTDDAVYYNTKQVRELFRKYGLEDYLDEVMDLLRQSRHFGIKLYYFAKKDITFMSHQHSRKLGINNKAARHPGRRGERELLHKKSARRPCSLRNSFKSTR